MLVKLRMPCQLLSRHLWIYGGGFSLLDRETVKTSSERGVDIDTYVHNSNLIKFQRP